MYNWNECVFGILVWRRNATDIYTNVHYTIFPLLCGHLCIFECLFIVIMDAHDDLCALTAPEQSWQHHTKICCFFLSSFPLFLFFTFSFSFILPCVSFFRHCSLLCLHCKQTPNNTRYVYCLSDGTVKSYLSKHSYMYLWVDKKKKELLFCTTTTPTKEDGKMNDFRTELFDWASFILWSEKFLFSHALVQMIIQLNQKWQKNRTNIDLFIYLVCMHIKYP